MFVVPARERVVECAGVWETRPRPPGPIDDSVRVCFVDVRRWRIIWGEKNESVVVVGVFCF